MNNLIKATFVLIPLLLGSASAKAEFIPTDVFEEGDGLATLDTETGIEWLDFTEMLGLNLTEVFDKLATSHDGWRFATKEETDELLGKAYSGSEPTRADVFTFTDAFGVTNTYDYERSIMQYGTIYENGAIVGHSVVDYVDSIQRARIYTSDTNRGLDFEHNWYSFILVSDGGVTLSSIQDPSLNAMNPNSPYSVPIWGGFGLLSLGLLFSLQRKKM